MRTRSHRPAALFAILAAAAALGVALGSEYWGGLVPCALCLLERWPYRVVIALGVLALVLPWRPGRAVLILTVAVFLAGAVLAGVHVGVEWGLWPSPLPECAAPHFVAGTIAQRLAAMPALPSKPCDAPTYLLPWLPVSMATMNLLYALAAAAILTISIPDGTRRRR
ncbi:MAG TPA: disulfide bond formation protein B [Acetobacteraceae bacterium]|nr:disulfide bond formation protein B [Acetobacteraceae bacterium]